MNGLMVGAMKDAGKMTNFTGKEHTSGQMAENTKVVTTRIGSMDTVPITGRMVEYTRVAGSTANNTVWGCILTTKELQDQGFGAKALE